MSEIRLLDCTLRDGGYVNDWKFGRTNLTSIFERLVDAGVDIIEVGFLDDRRPFDIDRSIMPDTSCVEKIYGGLNRGNSMVVGMIDYGTCGIENLQPCSESWLDGIRVIFKKHLMHEAMEFCRQVKALGYTVFSQMVSITSFTDEDLMELIGLVNDVEPYAVSMVDTYGLFYPETMLHYYELLDTHVKPGIGIGFHAHNNLQMAFANSLAFLAKPRRHDIVVDGTLYGMGKSAGNAPLELLGMRMNELYGKHYRIDAMLEAVQESVMDYYQQFPWGYKTFFYLSAKNRCHPNYVTYFENKENLSVSKVDRLLDRIEGEDTRLLYDKAEAEQIYRAYLSGEGNDEEAVRNIRTMIGGRKLLVVGPGKNIALQKGKVDRFIEQEHPFILAINYIPENIPVDAVFITKLRRYHEMTLALKEPRCKDLRLIATSNVEPRGTSFDVVVNRAPLLETSEEIIDNSFLMLLKLLLRMELPAVYCAGFDGYSSKDTNYYKPAMEYDFVRSEAYYLNAHMGRKVIDYRREMDITFITYSAYDNVEDVHEDAN